MSSRSPKARRFALIVTAVAVVCAALAPPALSKAAVSFKRIGGYASPGTPAKYNKVGILKVGSKKARNVLVLNPGTSASAAYFAPLAKDIVSRAKGWQVWAVERRENLLEDHSELNRVKAGKGSSQGALQLLPRLHQRPEHREALPVRLRFDRSATRTSGACAPRSRTCTAWSSSRSSAAAR